MEAEKPKIAFKSLKRKKPLRHRGGDSDDADADNDDGEDVVNKELINETLELQKLRKRAHGVNAITEGRRDRRQGRPGQRQRRRKSCRNRLLEGDPDP